MQASIKAVFFDIDGVLLDSLPQHLRICRDEAAKFGLNLTIPSVEEFRHIVSTGTKVSPMLYFFLAVGFPEDIAKLAVEDYDRDFADHYRPNMFPSVDDVLSQLHHSGLKIGLITSNIRANVEPVLGDLMRYFENSCLFYFDRYPEPESKSWCLREGARLLNIDTRHCIYVGDQPGDALAAQEADAQFLGVTYGWGITKRDTRYRKVDSVAEIAIELTGQAALP
jgi:phosphoglycolate phosphatase